MLITTPVFAQKTNVQRVEWTIAAKLQNTDGSVSLGFAGAINAVCNDVLIVAGGANFPDKKPWNGGTKHYSDEIHVLQKTADGFVWNKKVDSHLPEPIAYCGNISTPVGVVFAGGENDKGLSNKAYLVNWTENSKITIKQLADLPSALTNIALTNIGNVVYAAGGDERENSSSTFFSIDLNQENPGWNRLPDMPTALGNAVLIAQKNKQSTAIYLIGGRTKTASGISHLQHTTFMFNVQSQTWRQMAAISDGKNVTNFSAGTGVPMGDHWILLTGGDSGQIFHKIENYLAQIANCQDLETKNRLVKEKNELNINHKGFYNDILLYNTIKNSWSKVGELPFPAPVTTTATMWNGNIILSNGEVKPGVRTPNVMLGTIK
jgi:N-acetylneuraminate epimerase